MLLNSYILSLLVFWILLSFFFIVSLYPYSFLFKNFKSLKNLYSEFNFVKASFLISLLYFLMFLPIFFIHDFSFGQLILCNFFSYTFALDSKSFFLILLTLFIFPIVIASSWNLINHKVEFYYWLLITLELCLILTFLCFDLFLFYILFEFSLIPMSLMIGIWGSRSRKINAVFYFFMYTTVGSLLFLISILYLNNLFGNLNFFFLFNYNFSNNQQILLWLSFFITFATKVPMFPFHLWLPEAHVEASTPSSIILAALLLKLGYYGFIRFFINLFPFANVYFNPLVYTLCSIGILYGSFLALAQIDFKKLIAYSSIAHMNLCVLSIFSNDIICICGGYVLMLGHGLVSAALFFLVGKLYERFHTRLIDYYSGLSFTMPIFSTIFFFFTISNFAFPISLNFVGELLIVLGLIHNNFLNIFILSFYSVLTVSYSLLLFTRIFYFSPAPWINWHSIQDLSYSEFLILLPLALGNFFLCFFNKNLLFFISSFNL